MLEAVITGNQKKLVQKMLGRGTRCNCKMIRGIRDEERVMMGGGGGGGGRGKDSRNNPK